VLEIEPDTVRSRLARARAALREALAEMHDD
jgi:DNA-directed RNA polymerase specialized sigma24 family protein